MGKADDGLRNIFKKNLKPLGFEMLAIETGGTASGVPDTMWLHKGNRLSGWIEHKATSGWAVNVSPHQVGLLWRLVEAGCRVHVAVRAHGKGASNGAGDGLWLVRGECAGALVQGGLDGLPDATVLGKWYGDPRKWDWETIARLLLQRDHHHH